MLLTTLSSGHQARHDLPAVAAVDFEIGVGGQDHGVGQVSLMRTRQASARLMGTSAYLARKSSTRAIHPPRLNASRKCPRRRSWSRAPGVGCVQQKKRLGQDGFAGKPRQRLTGKFSRAQAWCSSRGSSKRQRAPLSTMQFLGTDDLRQFLFLGRAKPARTGGNFGLPAFFSECHRSNPALCRRQRRPPRLMQSLPHHVGF